MNICDIAAMPHNEIGYGLNNQRQVYYIYTRNMLVNEQQNAETL